MVTVTFNETYDLSTKTGKMTLIGIHTPTRNIIQRLYPGFLMQYSRMQILSQDVTCACASMLSADPLQVGTEAGDIAPEDLFNPLLYKATTNDSMTALESRIQGIYHSRDTLASVNGESLVASNENVTAYSDEFNVYYALLSDRSGFRTAAPQAGFSMINLRPMVFEKWYNSGYNAYSGAMTPGGTQPAALPSDTYPVNTSTPGYPGITNIPVQAMRGSAHPMPAFNTTYETIVQPSGSEGTGTSVKAGFNDSWNAQSSMPEIPTCFTALVVVPPSRLSRLYYRMVVSTTVSFFDPRPQTDLLTFRGLALTANDCLYKRDYSPGGESAKSALLPLEESTVSVSEDATITKVMEGTK